MWTDDGRRTDDGGLPYYKLPRSLRLRGAKKSVAEFGHNGRLKIYVDPKKIYVDPGIQGHFSKNGLVYLAEISYGVLVGP